MKKQLFILSQILLLNFTLTFAQQADDCELTAAIDNLVQEKIKPAEPGITVLVAKNDRIIFERGYGMANLEWNIPLEASHVFRIGSITKQFTAIAILQLMEQGKIGLQDEITKYIPDYPTTGHKITIEHLLTHTSGIQSYTSLEGYHLKMALDMKPQELIDLFKNQPMRFEPGTDWEYNNSGYFLLGFIIEKITGKTYADYIKDNIFTPLGMTHSSYGSNSEIINNRVSGYIREGEKYENARLLSMTQPYAAGSIQSTVGDLFKWHHAVHSGQLVKKETLQLALTNHRLPNGKMTDYGYGWRFGNIQGSRSIDHGGGINGSRTMSVFLPDENVYVAVFANCECISAKDIAIKIAAIAIGKPYDQSTISLSTSILQQYTGIYEISRDFSFKVTLEDEKLFVQATGQEKLEMSASGPDKFFLKINDAQLQFIADDSGKIIKAIINQGGRDTEALKVL